MARQWKCDTKTRPSPRFFTFFHRNAGGAQKNLDNFKSLIAQAGQSYRVIGLSMTRQDLASYLSREHLNVPVFADVDSTIVSAYQLSATPTTIVVSPSAKVLKVWTGAYQEGTRQEIETFLAVHLLPCCENNP
jgi:peroxiredoxin